MDDLNVQKKGMNVNKRKPCPGSRETFTDLAPDGIEGTKRIFLLRDCLL